MKVDFATPSTGICLLLAFSITLHGCVPWEVRDDKPPPPPGVPAPEKLEQPEPESAAEPEPADGETEAQCRPGGKFDCAGDSESRKWCAEMKEQCKGGEEEEKAEEVEKPCPKAGKGGCIPECTWECEAQKCHQECKPVCLPPVCSTRCANFNTDGCKMACGQPSCSVVCPKNYCPRQDCPQCETRCGEAVCKMSCPETPQKCRHVCAKPACKWECGNPQNCPKPKCQLKCQKPADCTNQVQLVNELPPLAPGETDVLDSHFKGSLMPSSFLQAEAGEVSTMHVSMTSMGQDHALKTHQVELSFTQEAAVATTWAKKVSRRSGQTSESHASCTNGRFQCKGEAAWCAGHKKSLCKSNRNAFLQRQSSVQGQLRKCKNSGMLNGALLQRASSKQGHLQP